MTSGVLVKQWVLNELGRIGKSVECDIWGCGYPCVNVLAVERWCYDTCFVLVSYFKGAPIPPCLA